MPSDLFKLDVGSVSADVLKDVYKVSPVKLVNQGAIAKLFNIPPKRTPLHHYIIYQNDMVAGVSNPFTSVINKLIKEENTNYAGKKDEIHAITVWSIDEFINKWNMIGLEEKWLPIKGHYHKEIPVGIVVIGVHGEPKALRMFYPTTHDQKNMSDSRKEELSKQFEKESKTYEKIGPDKTHPVPYLKFTTEKFGQLQEKTIDTLIVLSCHSGNLDCGQDGVAPTLVKNNAVKYALAPDGMLEMHLINPGRFIPLKLGSYQTAYDSEFPRHEPKGFITYPNGKPHETGIKKVLDPRELLDLAHNK